MAKILDINKTLIPIELLVTESSISYRSHSVTSAPRVKRKMRVGVGKNDCETHIQSEIETGSELKSELLIKLVLKVEVKLKVNLRLKGNKLKIKLKILSETEIEFKSECESKF